MKTERERDRQTDRDRERPPGGVGLHTCLRWSRQVRAGLGDALPRVENRERHRPRFQPNPRTWWWCQTLVTVTRGSLGALETAHRACAPHRLEGPSGQNKTIHEMLCDLVL